MTAILGVGSLMLLYEDIPIMPARASDDPNMNRLGTVIPLVAGVVDCAHDNL